MRKFLIVIAICVAGWIVMYYCDPIQYQYMPKCIFKLLTGLNCPGCGIQRSIHALLHGNVKEAIQYNYYLVYSFPYALSFLLIWLMPEGRKKVIMKSYVENRNVVNLYIISFLAWLVIRNIFKI